MSLVVQIFRTDNYVPDGEIPLVPLLNAIFAEVIGPDRKSVVFELLFYQIQDLMPARDTPSLENLRASHGYVRVRILRKNEVIYQHPHPVRELIGEPLRVILRKRDPQVTHWGYGIRSPGLESVALVRPTPQAAHELRVRTRPRPLVKFSVEEMPDPNLPETTLAALGGPEELARGNDGPPVVLVIPEDLVASFGQSHPFSDEIEEGGFLVGTVYRDANRPVGYLVRVTAALPAERTGASTISLTFTPESFLRVSQQVEARSRNEQLLGWYHTHLFAATSRQGLSSLDIELHRSTFRWPWQVAGLVNITDKGRVLRFYHGAGEQMALVPHWTVRG